MKSNWTVSRNDNDVVVVEVSCARCGRQHTSPFPEQFQHGGPCGVSIEFPPESVREKYAELKEAGRPRVKQHKPSPNLYQPVRFWLNK